MPNTSHFQDQFSNQKELTTTKKPTELSGVSPGTGGPPFAASDTGVVPALENFQRNETVDISKILEHWEKIMVINI